MHSTGTAPMRSVRSSVYASVGRPSTVCLSRPIRSPLQLAAVSPPYRRYIDPLLHGRRANAGSVTLSAYVVATKHRIVALSLSPGNSLVSCVIRPTNPGEFSTPLLLTLVDVTLNVQFH